VAEHQLVVLDVVEVELVAGQAGPAAGSGLKSKGRWATLVDVPGAPPTRRRKWVRRGLMAVALLIVAAVAGRVALPGFVHGWLKELLARQLNIDVEIGEIDIDLAAQHVTIVNLHAAVDGSPLAVCPRVDADVDILALVRGEDTTISLEFHELVGSIHLEEKGLNLGRIQPRDAPAEEPEPAPDAAAAEPAAHIGLNMRAFEAVIHFQDKVTDPQKPLSLKLENASVTAWEVLVSGPDEGAPIMDVRLLGAIHQEVGPALIAAGMWKGLDSDGTFLELHSAVTAFDVTTIPQYVTSSAGTILGGELLHVSGTVIASGGTIETGLIDIDVEGARSNLELRLGGPLNAPVFDSESPVLDAFRLSYLRVVDSGSGVFSAGVSVGESLWDRASGLVTETSGGVGSAVSELSLKKLGEGIWRGISGLFTGHSKDDGSADRVERWAGYARRQIAFREIFIKRRLEVARKREPDRVVQVSKAFMSESWVEDLETLIPADSRKPEDDDQPEAE
jgi:hypothetical protein